MDGNVHSCQFALLAINGSKLFNKIIAQFFSLLFAFSQCFDSLLGCLYIPQEFFGSFAL